MRELKFRAWDEHTKTFAEIDLRNRPPSVNMWQSDNLQQYTGLKDRNGKEVYEGDLLRGDDGPPFEVVYHNGSFKLQWSYEMSDGRIERSYTGIDAMSVLLTIVGNIHENPELLKEAQ